MLHEKRQEKKIELGNLVADREQLKYTLMNLFSFFFLKKKNYCACEIWRNCGSPSSRTSADTHT
jgi:hypothetical protein